MSIHVRHDYINQGDNWINYISHYKIPESNFTPIPNDNKCIICGNSLNKYNHCTICDVKYGEIKNVKAFVTSGVYVVDDDYDTIFASRTTLIENAFCHYCGSQNLYFPKKFYSKKYKSDYDTLRVLDTDFRAFSDAGERIGAPCSYFDISDLYTLDIDVMFDKPHGGYAKRCNDCGVTSISILSHMLREVHNLKKMERFTTFIESDGKCDSFIKFYHKMSNLKFISKNLREFKIYLNECLDISCVSIFLNPVVIDYCEEKFKHDKGYVFVKDKLEMLLKASKV